MIGYTKEYLKLSEVEFKENVKLKDFSPIRIGGNAAITAYPNSEKKFTELVLFLRNIGVKYKIVGGMSNILPDDGDYLGVIIKTERLNRFSIENERVYAMCGCGLPYLATACESASLCGMEPLSGIPGRVGGSVFGNAGAFGTEMSDIICSAKMFSPELNEVVELNSYEMNFSYRSSLLKTEPLILLSVNLRLKHEDAGKIRERTALLKYRRMLSQPIGEPSLGSIFKRIGPKLSAAQLIDSCGLKGRTIGGAVISEKHAGFIVNRGGATAADVKALIRLAEENVFDKYSVRPEREIEYLS